MAGKQTWTKSQDWRVGQKERGKVPVKGNGAIPLHCVFLYFMGALYIPSGTCRILWRQSDLH